MRGEREKRREVMTEREGVKIGEGRGREDDTPPGPSLNIR